MNKTLAAIFVPSEFQDISKRAQILQQIYSDWDKQKHFSNERIKDTEEIVYILSQRIEAEISYAMRLERISDFQPRKTLSELT